MLNKNILALCASSSQEYTHLFYPTRFGTYDSFGYDKDQTSFPGSYLRPNIVNGIPIQSFSMSAARRAWHLHDVNYEYYSFLDYWLSIPEQQLSLGKMHYNTDDEFYWAFPNREVGFVPNVEHKIAFTLERPAFDTTYIETPFYIHYTNHLNSENNIAIDWVVYHEDFGYTQPFASFSFYYNSDSISESKFTIQLDGTYYTYHDDLPCDNMIDTMGGFGSPITRDFLEVLADLEGIVEAIGDFVNMLTGGSSYKGTYTIPLTDDWLLHFLDQAKEWAKTQETMLTQTMSTTFSLDPLFNE